ncbi:MAG TPA: hypothetical protein VFO07_19440, partial [Roseiflexaceae bacterium]|nr:hypothetical protein [Roseiflexaceae bacterium]
LHLRSSPQDSVDLATTSLPLAQDARPGFYRFSFAPQSDSRGHDYYARFEFAGAGQLKIDRAAGDAYLDGALYEDDQPQDAQLTSALIYDVPRMFLGFAGQALGWLGVLLSGLLLYIIPGWALLAGLWPAARTLPWGAKLGLAGGLSLGLYPILLLWSALLGLHAGPLYAWAPVAIGLVALVWQNRGWRPERPASAWRAWRRSAAFWPDLALMVVLALVVVTRCAAADQLDAPLWGDSYHHTLIAQLLVDNGGLFDSWQPYAEMQSLTYHFGFHSAAAVLHWLGGLAVPKAVVWAGQLLNVLAALALYPLALRVGNSRWAGVGAVLVAGLLASMPAYYVNWGRYTQLAGQVILPAAIYLAWAAVENQQPTTENREPRTDNRRTAEPQNQELTIADRRWSSVVGRWSSFDWRFFILPWVALAGLALAHYRVLIFVVLFLPALLLVRLGRQPLLGMLTGMAVLCGGAALLVLPWFARLIGGRILESLAVRLSTSASAMPAATQEYNAPIDPRLVLPTLIWLLLLLSVAWGLWRRERDVVLFGLWWLFVVLAVNPHWLGLPGTGALTNFALLIAAYIPAGVLIGAALSWLVCWTNDERRTLREQTRRQGDEETRSRSISQSSGLPVSRSPGWSVVGRRWSAARGIALAALAALALWGTAQRLGDLAVAQSALVTRPDLRAADWIRANTPQDARFLVNSFFAYGGASVVGSDGGWWLPMTAGRQTTQPPLLYGTERGPRPDYRLWVNALPTALQQKRVDDPEVLAMLRERGVTHIYVGQRQGRVNYSGPVALDPQQLLDSSHFRPVYHQDRVWVFEVVD